ncbi:hypothetical protein E4K72_13025 [Oxalobacteraceae bacterium OM1]|nr:hypothetical protein E4K72_13025 [Oxalobacteraceae bacterium OM1]
MVLNTFRGTGIGIVGLLLWIGAGNAEAIAASAGGRDKCDGTEMPGQLAPTPADPYPLMAAGWGPELGNGVFASRWAEDWTGMRAAGTAPELKAMPMGGDASLTVSAEARLRYDDYRNAQLKRGNTYQQSLFRGVLGADLRINSALRFYGEVASGQAGERRDTASANFQNDASLQQLFVDVRDTVGETLVGAMFGRQEFADGPRQLISLSDGPNIHRSWNGLRVYAHRPQFRVGAFDFRATRLGRGSFDDVTNYGERLQGITGSVIVTPEGGPNTYLEPFLYHTKNPNFSSGSRTAADDRYTYGARLWGRKDAFRFDGTLAYQTGHFADRDVNAWGLFLVSSLELAKSSWKPRLTARVDVASGGGTYGRGTIKSFNQLYASSNYLGEGQFLSLSNLVMVTPGLAVSPTATTNLSAEYGLARRLNEDDAVYAGGMRAYAGTQNLPGKEIGGLLRVIGSWAANNRLTVFLNYERFNAGDVVKHAALPSGSYRYIGATYRF